MKKWWKDVAIRTVRTMAQAAVGAIGGASIFSEVDWLMVLSTSLMAGVMCVLMCVGTPVPEEAITTTESEE